MATSGGVTEEITVTQSAAALSIYPNSISFGEGEDSATITVTSDLDWMPTSNEPWLNFVRLGPGSNSFRVHASANTGNQRIGTVTVTSGGVRQTITVIQSARLSTPTPVRTRTPTPWGWNPTPTPVPTIAPTATPTPQPWLWTPTPVS